MSKPTVIEGRVWVITDNDRTPIDDIDTDMIFHNAHLAITDIDKMGPHTFGNLSGWEEFPSKVAENDILVVGKNFGAGSSRQQAVDCFRALKMSMIVGESFGSIYWRNAVNTGFPILVCDGICSKENNGQPFVKSGDKIKVNIESGVVDILESGKKFEGKPFSRVQMDIYNAEGLFNYAKKNLDI